MAPAPKQPGWKKQQRLEQCEERSHREANKTKRQGHQPDKGQENQGKQRNGPAQYEQNAPENKKQQDFHFLAFKFGVGHSTPVNDSKSFRPGTSNGKFKVKRLTIWMAAFPQFAYHHE
jgi:hypothetical protein